MRALVSIAIILVTAVAVVVGGNAVIGEDKPDSPSPTITPRPTVDPACEANPPAGDAINCLPLEWFVLPERPDVTPRGFIETECVAMTQEEMAEWAKTTPAPDSTPMCVGLGGGTSVELDYGEWVSTVTINGKVIELPEDHSQGYAVPSGVTTITIGDSWVKYVARNDGHVLRDYRVAPGDEEAMQPILDALEAQ